MELEVNQVYCMEALELLARLPPQSVDAYITDLPYGTTACSWDEIIPFEPMWKEVKRTLKPRGVFVTTASQPFTSKLIMSNLDWFKYEWIWVKAIVGMFVHAKNRPLKEHENIVIFSNGVVNHPSLTDNRMNYYPQIENNGKPYSKRYKGEKRASNTNFGWRPSHVDYEVNHVTSRYPSTVLEFPNGNNGVQHPTQKPVALYEYLIRTYTLENDLVVDFCCGSGTTGLAARNLKRRYILNDKERQYVDIAIDRLKTEFGSRKQKAGEALDDLPLFRAAGEGEDTSGDGWMS